MKSYRDLRVWHDSIALVENIYRMTAHLPKDEQYGLIAQMRRAAVSIPSNIAEGQGRETRGEWRQFLGYARGSLYELQTQITVAVRLQLLEREVARQLFKDTRAIGRGIAGLIRYTRT
jgi:four helix bundle protein